MVDPFQESERLVGERHGLAADRERVALQFLLIDIDLALAMLERARLSRDPAMYQRRRAAALRAYDIVGHVLRNVRLSAEQTTTIESRLLDLRKRLAA